MMSATGNPSVATLRAAVATSLTRACAGPVHRARAVPRRDLMRPVIRPSSRKPGKRVVVIEAIVVADDRRVDRAGHRHRARRARSRARSIVDHELPRLAELERAVAVEGGADRLRIDVGDAQRGLRIEAVHSALAVLIDALPHGTVNVARIDPPDCGVITRSWPENAANVTCTGPSSVRSRSRPTSSVLLCTPRSVDEVARRSGDRSVDRRHAGHRHGRRRHPLDRLVEIDRCP